MLLLLCSLAGACGALVRREAPRPSLQLGRSGLSSALRLRGGELILVENEETLQYMLDGAGSKLVVVDWFAEWCGPCKKIAPLLESLSEKSSNRLLFLKVDVDAARELAQAYGVKSMPTIMFFRQGKLVNQIVGADMVRLQREIARENLNPALRMLTNNGAVVGLLTLYLTYSIAPPAWQRAMLMQA